MVVMGWGMLLCLMVGRRTDGWMVGLGRGEVWFGRVEGRDSSGFVFDVDIGRGRNEDVAGRAVRMH